MYNMHFLLSHTPDIWLLPDLSKQNETTDYGWRHTLSIGLMVLVNHGCSQEENSQGTISYHNIELYATRCWPLAKVIIDKQGACLRICTLEDWEATFGLLKVFLNILCKDFYAREADIYKHLHFSGKQQYIVGRFVHVHVLLCACTPLCTCERISRSV